MGKAAVRLNNQLPKPILSGPFTDDRSLHYSPIDQKLIVHLPLLSHELVDDLVEAFKSTMTLENQSSIRRGGSANVKLKDGTVKSPDTSFYDNTPPRDSKKESVKNMAAIQSNPTMVWEIAMSQSEKKLCRDCGRFIAASGGLVKSAFGLSAECGRANENRLLKKIAVWMWGIKDFYFTPNPTPQQLEDANCGVVRRLADDGFTEQDDEEEVKPAKYFIFSSYDGEKISNWKAVGREEVVSSFNPFLIYVFL